jgi:hypothetical protein
MGFIKNAVLLTLAFAYGVFTMLLYACISISKGTYFTRRTEKETLELQIGKSFVIMTIITPRHWTMPCKQEHWY